jgi:hypothetical protein
MSPTQSAADRTEVGPLQASTLGPVQTSAPSEIVDRAIRALDLRSLGARIRERSDLDEEQAMALAREELRAVRAERG